MLKINTDLSALRRNVATPANPAPKTQAASTSTPEKAETSEASEPRDSAELKEAHRAIAQANVSASRSPLRDLQSAANVAKTLRETISQRQNDVFAAHQGLSPDRISSLLQ